MKRILVALDTTELSALVLDRGVQVARETGGKLKLLRVVTVRPERPPPSTFTLPVTVGSEGFVADAEEALRELEGDVPEELRDGILVEVGAVVDGICAAAKRYDADLVVIGAHQHGAVARMLGTTAAGVANHIDRPVLVVRPETAAAPAAGAVIEASRPLEPVGPDLPVRSRKSNEHTMLEVTTIAGGVVGAALGAIGGPPGAIAGGAIGTAVGMLAGVALEREDGRAEAHDRTLDDAIGVTSGDLGAQERASSAFASLEKGAGDDGALVSASAVMRADHERLEKFYAALTAAYKSGEWEAVRKEWDVFDAAIKSHMAREESIVFPAFREVDPDEAQLLLDQHTELRALLGTLSVAIDLHAVPAGDVDVLLARIRAHAAREAFLLYPWMDERLGDKAHVVSPAA